MLFAIAFNTFRETIRDKILYNLIVFALIIIGSSFALPFLTVEYNHNITIEMGLNSIWFFGVVISIFLGINLISKEIDQHTIYSVISKPIPRYMFLLGKYIGLAITLAFNIIIMIILLSLVLIFTQGYVQLNLLIALLVIYLELLIIIAFSLLFSTFASSTILSTMFSFSLFLIGQFTLDIKVFGEKSEIASFTIFSKILYYILPNLGNFKINALIVNNQTITIGYIISLILYALLYISFLFSLSIIIFQRREFK